MRLCDYGCGQEAKYQFKNGRLCCSDHYKKCSERRKAFSGENNPTKRLEVRRRIRELKLGRKNLSNSGKNNYLFGKYGESHSSWKGGCSLY